MEIRIPTRRTSIQYITMTTKQRIANNFTDVIGSVGILSVEVYGLRWAKNETTG
jgi:hypothetical protein